MEETNNKNESYKEHSRMIKKDSEDAIRYL